MGREIYFLSDVFVSLGSVPIVVEEESALKTRYFVPEKGLEKRAVWHIPGHLTGFESDVVLAFNEGAGESNCVLCRDAATTLHRTLATMSWATTMISSPVSVMTETFSMSVNS